MGSATGGPGGPWTPRIKLGGPVIGLDPPDILKNIKILCENKRINNSFENSSLIVTVSKHFSKFSKKFFLIYSESSYFLYTQNFWIFWYVFSHDIVMDIIWQYTIRAKVSPWPKFPARHGPQMFFVRPRPARN